MATSTSALMSNSVTNPTMAPLTMGIPHNTIAIQAGLNGRWKRPPRTAIKEMPSSSSVRFSSFLNNAVNLSVPSNIHMGVYVLRIHYTPRGIYLQ